MTREEAIEELKILKEDYWDDDGYGHETKQYDDTMLALDMAIKALEQEPNNSENPTSSIKIKVGDEVTDAAGINGIVVREPYPIGSDNELFVLVWYGRCLSSNSLKNVVPTGRHFPQITEVLEQLKESC